MKKAESARVTLTVCNFAKMAKPASISVFSVCLAAAVFLTLANPAEGQNQTQCDVPGECIGMHYTTEPSYLLSYSVHFHT